MLTEITKNINLFKEEMCAILIDDISSEERIAFIGPALGVKRESLNNIATISSGLFNVVVSSLRAEALGLKKIPNRIQKSSIDRNLNNEMLASVEARVNVTTGISIDDRLITLNAIGSLNPSPRELVSPGHIFPALSKNGGMLASSNLMDAALDAVIAIGASDASLVVEGISQDTGQYLSKKDAIEISTKYGWPIISMKELFTHQLSNKTLVEKITEALLPISLDGEFKAVIFQSFVHKGEHLALVHGDITSPEPILTRVQSEKTIQDVFGSSNEHTSRWQLQKSLEAIRNAKKGVIVYLRKPDSSSLSDELSAHNTSSSMNIIKNYGIGAQIIRKLGVKKINLLTSNTKQIEGLSLFGIEIANQTILS